MESKRKMQIKGKKIYLKKRLTKSEYSALLEWFNDIEVMKYINFAKKAIEFSTIRQVKLFFKGSKNHMLFGIYTDKNKLIGYAEIFGAGKKSREFGIIIGNKDYWGKGIGKEATELILDYSFKKLKLNKIVLTTTDYNKRAIKLYKKLGFKSIKKIPKDREVYHNNKWVKSTTVCMEFKKQDYRQ